MNATFAHDIIEKSALGIDPSSGTPLEESVFHDPTVIRALFMAKGALATAGEVRGKGMQGAPRAHPQSANAGKRWEAADKETLRDLHTAGATIRQIALQLGRSSGGIIGQLVKEGLIKDRDEGLAVVQRQDAVVGSEPKDYGLTG